MYIHIYIYMHIYIYLCMCVCVCPHSSFYDQYSPDQTIYITFYICFFRNFLYIYSEKTKRPS